MVWAAYYRQLLAGLSASLMLCAIAPLTAQSQPIGDLPDADEPIACLIEPLNLATLAPSRPGVVEDILVDRGERVTKGQLLVQLQSEVETAEVELRRVMAQTNAPINLARARSDFLKRKVNRLTQLKASDSIAEAELDEAQTELLIADQELNRARHEKKIAQQEHKKAVALLSRTRVKSPFDGVITNRLLSAGEYANEQTPILKVAQTNALQAKAYLPLRLFQTTKKGTHATIIAEQPIGGRYDAIVAVIDPVIDAASGLFSVQLDILDTNPSLPSGVRCTVEINTDQQAAGAHQSRP